MKQPTLPKISQTISDMIIDTHDIFDITKFAYETVLEKKDWFKTNEFAKNCFKFNKNNPASSFQNYITELLFFEDQALQSSGYLYMSSLFGDVFTLQQAKYQSAMCVEYYIQEGYSDISVHISIPRLKIISSDLLEKSSFLKDSESFQDDLFETYGPQCARLEKNLDVLNNTKQSKFIANNMFYVGPLSLDAISRDLYTRFVVNKEVGEK